MAVQGSIIGMFLVVLAAFLTVVPQIRAAIPPAGCIRRCGDVGVPYPFGMDDGDENCYMGVGFGLTCNNSFNPPKLFEGNMEVTSIRLDTAQITILLNLSSDCYESGWHNKTTWSTFLGLPYTLSYEDNVFTAVGCETMAEFVISENKFAGCISGCSGIEDVADGNCSGIGCCHASIPRAVRWYNTSFINRRNTSDTNHFNPCSYSFISQKDNYTFSISDLKHMVPEMSFPVVLDFTIDSTLSCSDAATDNSTYACVDSNSECVDSASGSGYVCNCSLGYEGNPYIPDGCKDIDECQSSRDLYPCYGICTNLPGNYSCTCEEGSYADDPRKTRCMPKPEKEKLPLATKLTIGIGCSILLLLLIGAACCLEFQRRKINVLRKKNFDSHGGSVLQQLLSDEGVSNFKIFSMNELQRATNNFDKDHILGVGGFGTVYKGTLDDQRSVAIKRASVSSDKNGRDFANELHVLSKVNHKHIVELFGCCLEDEVPMLVYKFIPKGTLYDFIHGGSYSRIPFATRLRIATEAAAAFKYLHVDTSTPILHGDVKSLNILLDEGYTVKISDFGTSKLSPQDKKQFTTMVQGTYGYLDPEYVLNGHLTEKSDVYSFGVVLVELMTRRKPFNFDWKSEEEGSLASKFITCMENEKLVDILDLEIIEEGGLTYEVMKVADVALRCLNVKGKERPTMREVLMDLESIRVPERHPWARHVPENTAPLVRGPSLTTGSLEIGIGNKAVLGIGRGR